MQPRTRWGGEEEEFLWIKLNPVTSKAVHVLVYTCILVCFHLPKLDTGITGLRGLYSAAGCLVFRGALESMHRPTGTHKFWGFVVIQTTVCRRRFKKTMLPSSELSKYCRGFQISNVILSLSALNTSYVCSKNYNVTQNIIKINSKLQQYLHNKILLYTRFKPDLNLNNSLIRVPFLNAKLKCLWQNFHPNLKWLLLFSPFWFFLCV